MHSQVPYFRARALLVMLPLVVACGESEPVAVAAASAAPPSSVAVNAGGDPLAKHGGSVTRVGNHPVEVVTHASGQVYAYVEADVAAPENATMRIEAPVRNGRRPVDLRWNRAQRRYEGRVVRETIVPGPVNITYTIDGIALVAIIPVIIVGAPLVVHVEYDNHRHHGKHKHKWRH